jgi:hypothetical protein
VKINWMYLKKIFSFPGVKAIRARMERPVPRKVPNTHVPAPRAGPANSVTSRWFLAKMLLFEKVLNSNLRINTIEM